MGIREIWEFRDHLPNRGEDRAIVHPVAEALAKREGFGFVVPHRSRRPSTAGGYP